MKNVLIVMIIFSGFVFVRCESDTASNFTITPTGKGGSMARFALGANHLYVVNNHAIKIYELSTDGTMLQTGSVEVGFGIETIAVRDNQLFLGANDAMYIYSISNPYRPSFVSRYAHITACDPVVVSGNYAYVTLRIGGTCRAAGSDALEVIDISNPQMPELIKSYPVNTPYGLGIDGNTLFLCEGNNGLKIFNAEKPNEIQQIKHYKDIHAYDVIPNNGTLIMTGDDGIFQFDYADLNDVHLLSHIKTQ